MTHRNGKQPSTAVARTERPKCGARARQRDGAPCRNRAGFRTDHEGTGRCFLHGGVSGTVKHGRYSTVKRDAIRELIAQHADDPSPLDLLPELAALRALFQDYIERYDLMREALFAWHASYSVSQRVISEEQRIAFEHVIEELEAILGDEATEKQTQSLALARDFVTQMAQPVAEGKPRQLLDLADASRILAEIGKMVERIEKIRAENAISRGDLLRVMTEMGRVVQAHVPDEAVQQKISDAWLTIRL